MCLMRHISFQMLSFTYKLLQELIKNFKRLLGVLSDDSNQKPVEYFQKIANSKILKVRFKEQILFNSQ